MALSLRTPGDPICAHLETSTCVCFLHTGPGNNHETCSCARPVTPCIVVAALSSMHLERLRLVDLRVQGSPMALFLRTPATPSHHASQHAF